jgi:hypothetical protein
LLRIGCMRRPRKEEEEEEEEATCWQFPRRFGSK